MVQRAANDNSGKVGLYKAQIALKDFDEDKVAPLKTQVRDGDVELEFDKNSLDNSDLGISNKLNDNVRQIRERIIEVEADLDVVDDKADDDISAGSIHGHAGHTHDANGPVSFGQEQELLEVIKQLRGIDLQPLGFDPDNPLSQIQEQKTSF